MGLIESTSGGEGGGGNDLFTLPERIILPSPSDNWEVLGNKLNMSIDTSMPNESPAGYAVFYQGVDGGGLSTVFNVDVASPPLGRVIATFEPSPEVFMEANNIPFSTTGSLELKIMATTIKSTFNPSTVDFSTMSGILSGLIGDPEISDLSASRDPDSITSTFTNTDLTNVDLDFVTSASNWGDIYGIAIRYNTRMSLNHDLLAGSNFDLGTYDSSNYAKIIRSGF